MSEEAGEGRRRYQRVHGAVRTELRKRMARDYRAGSSIRAIATTYGHCYGTAYALLLEAGVAFRDRNGRDR